MMDAVNRDIQNARARIAMQFSRDSDYVKNYNSSHFDVKDTVAVALTGGSAMRSRKNQSKKNLTFGDAVRTFFKWTPYDVKADGKRHVLLTTISNIGGIVSLPIRTLKVALGAAIAAPTALIGKITGTYDMPTPYNVGYLYAAHDPHITTELCDYQRRWLREDSDREDMQKLYWVFKNIEMPCVDVVATMEDNGILFDKEYAQELSIKYHKLLDESLDNFYKLLSKYDKEIEEYKLQNPDNKLDNPINISSPTQLAILFYDILEVSVIDKKSPRGTGIEILSKIDNPLAKAVLEYRAIEKQINTYIDKLPNCVNPKDGRIHCSFNQYGADTGRFSSSDPNLQNIPSHNKDIRKMFKATNEEKLVSTDTQQFVVDRWCEVECADEWKYADKIVVGDELVLDDGSCVNVCEVNVNKDTVVIDFT